MHIRASEYGVRCLGEMDEMRHEALSGFTESEQQGYSERVRDIMLAQPLNTLTRVELEVSKSKDHERPAS